MGLGLGGVTLVVTTLVAPRCETQSTQFAYSSLATPIPLGRDDDVGLIKCARERTGISWPSTARHLSKCRHCVLFATLVVVSTHRSNSPIRSTCFHDETSSGRDKNKLSSIIYTDLGIFSHHRSICHYRIKLQRPIDVSKPAMC